MAKKSPATSDDHPRPKSRRKTAPAPPAPTHDNIAARAYEIYLRRGGGHGGDWDDWLSAERELASMS